MRYLSVCSGIEAASVAFEPLGWKPLAFSEIEAFPRAVLQHHYPDTPCHGDFTVLKDEPWIVDADMLCGGTPCQAFSVAGNRQSLADDRGNLTLQFVLLADAIDDLRSTAGRDPAWILWENVPGVFSTADNAFGSFLGGLCGRDEPIPEPADGWPSAGVVDGPTRVAAWRVLDAQHFGLAQRRKRVFVLAKGGAGRWAAADALLPIIESSRWHPAPSRSAGEGVAGATAEGTGVGVEGVDHENNRSNPQPGDPCHTLHRNDPPMLVRMREGKEGGGKGPLVSNDQSLTLATANDQVLAVRTANTNANGHGVADGITHTLDQAQGQAVMTGMQVRRLTPTECCRLQGFPDDYLDITYRGKPAADGPKYKALGNSWAVTVVNYIGQRIQAVSK
jgi:DNA (cytosine-5)-methyltransferase 1